MTGPLSQHLYLRYLEDISTASIRSQSTAGGYAEVTTETNTKKLEVSRVWLSVTLASLIALWVYAPSVLATLGFLGVVITTHEAGHFFVAKKSGMKPTEFFWGFGPEVVAIQTKNTRYGIKALSVGGYVKLEGMTATSELPEGFDEAGTFRAATPMGRLATILAGPFVNFAVAAVAFMAVGLLRGVSVIEAIQSGFSATWEVITNTLVALGLFAADPLEPVTVIAGESSEATSNFLGFVGMAQFSSANLAAGLAPSLVWLAILSTAIGLVNLLPFPPLDGGHAIAAIVDAVGRRLSGVSDYMFDLKRLEPVAVVTLGALLYLSGTALIIEIQNNPQVVVF